MEQPSLIAIIVNLQYEAVHNWPNCNIPDVDYLRHPHRHTFHICCKKTVNHADRDVEIIQFKRTVFTWLHQKYQGELGSTSCEQLALILLNQFELVYCSVMEDGENGAEVWL